MTRNLIATASRALGVVRPASARRSRRLASVCLENLEGRLSLSSVSAGGPVPLIKHGADPTAVQVQPMLERTGAGADANGQHFNPAILFPVFAQAR
jgi:hypothetical protein